jgi:nitrogen fixation NifU-like protein
MSDMRELYQEVILDHNRNPRNFGVLEGANRHAVGHNPLCGDNVEVFMDVEDGRIHDIRFKGNGCAISKASASMMTSELKGKTIEEARGIMAKFHDLVVGGGDESDDMGKLAVFSGVCDYPARVKCASLAWHTLTAALDGSQDPVSTEDKEIALVGIEAALV